MPTVLMRLAGAMQSWGTRSQFDQRDTELEPSKSGVLGLVCAAIGIDREDWASLEPLTHLRMGVRADQPGVLRVDYHTAQLRPEHPKTDTALSRRYYLCDAVFLVGLEGQHQDLLAGIHQALKNPRWTLSLGRKAFPPSQPVFLEDGLRDESLEDALRKYPFIGSERQISAGEPLRLSLQSRTAEGSLRFDQPDSSFADRRFTSRYVIPDSVILGGT
jgi:CRISPR system Cascade subunit CasD